jgi:hypothetical protein
MRNSSPEEVFTASLYQMDIERVRYALCRYLRTRILKIENMLEYVVTQVDVMDRLSKNEKIFATRLHNLSNNYLEDAVFNRVDKGLRESLETSSDNLRHAHPSMNVRQYFVCR